MQSGDGTLVGSRLVTRPNLDGSLGLAITAAIRQFAFPAASPSPSGAIMGSGGGLAKVGGVMGSGGGLVKPGVPNSGGGSGLRS